MLLLVLVEGERGNGCSTFPVTEAINNHCSMEEADTLATRIGIMAHGKLMVIGNSLHLKKRFGQVLSAHAWCVRLAHT